MRRGGAIFAGLLVALAGCQSTDKRLPAPSDDKFIGPDRTAEPSGRVKPNPDNPAHWLDQTKPDWMHGRTPASPSWNDPKRPDYDVAAETGGLLAGYVEDPDGRKVGKVYITVRETTDTNPKPIGVVTRPDGTFAINGLKPKKNYVLSVNESVDGRKLFQTVYVKPPNATVRIVLLEGDGGNPAPAPTPAPTPTPTPDDPLKKPPTNTIPGYPDGPLPVPKIGSERDPGVSPVGGFEVTPQEDGLPKVDRNDLSTDRGGPWRPPVADIPAPRTAHPIPSARGEVRKEAVGGFGFVGTDGRQTDLPGAKLVLVSFFTTGSMASVRAVPALNGLREKYTARGVEVAGMNCDDEPLDARVMAGERFRKEQGAGYPILTESGKRPGALLKQFGIAELPAAVLLNESGEVLWQGNPNKPTGLSEAIEKGR